MAGYLVNPGSVVLRAVDLVSFAYASAVFPVWEGEVPARERGIGNAAQAVQLRHRDQFLFVFAVEQVVIVLKGENLVQPFKRWNAGLGML